MKISLNGIRRLLTFRVVTEFFHTSDEPVARFDVWTGLDPAGPESDEKPGNDQRSSKQPIKPLVVTWAAASTAGWLAFFVTCLLAGAGLETAFVVANFVGAIMSMLIVLNLFAIWL